MSILDKDDPGRRTLLMGNEAIARGAIEAGVDFSSSYPGSPSSEIQDALAKTAASLGHQAHWAINEKVALEACIGASFAGLRAITSMKQNGLNVASDTLMTVNLSGINGGLVIVVCDDPQGHSSTNEMDSRSFARFADVPLLEPSSAEEALAMTKWAYELSEKLKSIVLIRSVTRISHARSDVTLGKLPERNRKPEFGRLDRYLSLPPSPQHANMHKKMDKARKMFLETPFNEYFGRSGARKIIIAGGTGWLYAMEALSMLGEAAAHIGAVKVGTTWPLPTGFLKGHLERAEEILVLEEIDPFLEDNLKSLIVDLGLSMKVYGKSSGHVAGRFGPGVGEIDADVALDAITRAFDIEIPRRADAEKASLFEQHSKELKAELNLPPRELAFCAGCPHRMSFWAVNVALKMDGRDGFVLGDIGCYSMGAGRTGFFLSRTMHCMGSGIGFANGLGLLTKDMEQPVVAFSGDSTFFHSGIPGLINAKYSRAEVLLVVLDNSATSMTGFQPHPGTGFDALGNEAPKVEIESITRGIGIDTYIADPFDLQNTIDLITDLLEEGGLKVLILRRKCALVDVKERPVSELPKISVDTEKCLGESCGCGRFCTRIFTCPALFWDQAEEKSKIDDALCVRCEACISICPADAIVRAEA